MSIRLTTLIENTAPAGLVSEHGFSMLIETATRRYLFDVGAGENFLENAAALGVTVQDADAVVLSHGHSDHAGGLAPLLRRAAPAGPVYVGRGFFDARYTRREETLVPIGSPLSERELLRAGASLRVVDSDRLALDDEVLILSGFSCCDPLEEPFPGLLCERAGHWETDRFSDELALALPDETGLTLISGCCHNGLISMCRHAQALLGKPVHTFIGGTHLMVADEARIVHTLDTLRGMGLRRLGACHCNGTAAADYFSRHFAGFFLNMTGTQLSL